MAPGKDCQAIWWAAVSATFIVPALGAFAIGIMIGGSEFSHQAFGDMVPLRDVFAALFFVLIGMLVDLY